MFSCVTIMLLKYFNIFQLSNCDGHICTSLELAVLYLICSCTHAVKLYEPLTASMVYINIRQWGPYRHLVQGMSEEGIPALRR